MRGPTARGASRAWKVTAATSVAAIAAAEASGVAAVVTAVSGDSDTSAPAGEQDHAIYVAQIDGVRF